MVRYNLWRDEEADPGHDHEEAAGQVVDVEVLQHVPVQPHLQTCSTVQYSTVQSTVQYSTCDAVVLALVEDDPVLLVEGVYGHRVVQDRVLARLVKLGQSLPEPHEVDIHVGRAHLQPAIRVSD